MVCSSPTSRKYCVCDPRKNCAGSRPGSKSDRIDARKLADLLYLDKLNPVYHGETGIRALQEVARSYLALTRDTTRVMNRVKALYRSWAIPCAGQRVYAPLYRSENGSPKIKRSWRASPRGDLLPAVGRNDCGRYCEQVRRDLLAEGRKHRAMRLLRQIPSIGPIRAVLLIALMQTPHRFSHQAATVGPTVVWHCKTSHEREYRIVDGPAETLPEIPCCCSRAGTSTTITI